MIPVSLQHTDLLGFWHQQADRPITKKDEEDKYEWKEIYYIQFYLKFDIFCYL